MLGEALNVSHEIAVAARLVWIMYAPIPPNTSTNPVASTAALVENLRDTFTFVLGLPFVSFAVVTAETPLCKIVVMTI